MSKSCPICNTDESLFKLSRCKDLICIECLYKHIQNNFSCNIQCPKEKCTKCIAEPDIRKFLSKAQEIKYENMCLNRYIKKCPTIGCAYFYDTDKTAPSIFLQCPQCDQPICSGCNFNHFSNEECNVFKEYRNEFGRQKLKESRTKQIQNLDYDNNLLESHILFKCSVCLTFIIPKDGYMLRCFCNYCKTCLKNLASTVEYENQMECQNCKTPWDENEKNELVGSEKLLDMRNKIMSNKVFHCKTRDCQEFWHKTSRSTEAKCDICHKMNCYSCDAAHEGQSCESYKNSSVYQNFLQGRRAMNLDISTKCFECNKLLILAKGCGAIKCNICNFYTCVYTGLRVGKGEYGCKCTPQKPCHKDCKHGCIPEDH